MPIPELIKSKFNEYGIEIINQYSYEKKHYFVTEDMMVCHPIESNKISIAFEANTIPERVGNNVLILQEIKEIDPNFRIMDSFLYDHNQNLICGKEAHDALEYKIGAKFVAEYQRKEEMFQNMLKNNICGTA